MIVSSSLYAETRTFSNEPSKQFILAGVNNAVPYLDNGICAILSISLKYL